LTLLDCLLIEPRRMPIFNHCGVGQWDWTIVPDMGGGDVNNTLRLAQPLQRLERSCCPMICEGGGDLIADMVNVPAEMDRHVRERMILPPNTATPLAGEP
jgi:hypothetical protein